MINFYGYIVMVFRKIVSCLVEEGFTSETESGNKEDDTSKLNSYKNGEQNIHVPRVVHGSSICED